MGKKGDKKEKKVVRYEDDDGDVPDDDRFTSKLSAPIFKNLSSEKHKVEIDDRFKSMLTDDRFKVLPGSTVDAYGRKTKKSKAGKQDVEELYQVEDSADDAEDDAKAIRPSKDKKKPSGKGGKAEMEDRLNYLTRLARGEISDDEDDSEDGSEDDSEDGGNGNEEEEDSDEEMLEVDPAEWEAIQLLNGKSPLDVPEEEDVEMGEATRRISILNCDWDNIKAEDLMMILQSFCPSGRQVHSVTVYPSDFGKEKMAEEAKYGPQGIWKNNEGDMSVDDESEEDDEEDDEEDNDSLYDELSVNEDAIREIEDEDEDQVGNKVEEDVEEDEEEEEDERPKRGEKKAKKGYGEFGRKKGAVGIVLHNELVQRQQKKSGNRQQDSDDEEEEEDEEDEESENDEGSDEVSEDESANNHQKKRNDRKKTDKSDSDYNAVALRQYELSKLRYYFAIAECDSVETANAISEALDGVEFEHSAMALDIRFVPDDLDLSEREVRDSCSHAPNAHKYKPPDFVVNAKQHTSVTCTWDEGEKDREKKLTNFSAWRNLKDSDFAQYLASESEEEEEEEEDEDSEEESSGDEDNHNNKSVTKSVKSAADRKKEKARAMRKLLLGDNDDDDSDSNAEDDFFNESLGGSDQDSDNDYKTKKSNKTTKKGKVDGKNVDDLGENDELVMTYVPEVEKGQILQRQREREGLTPYELDMQKSAEVKKQRKAARKAQIEEEMRLKKDEELMQQAALKKANKKRGRKNKASAAENSDNEDDDAEELGESYRGRVQQQTKEMQQQRKKKVNKKTPLTAIEDDLDRKNAQNAHRAVVTDSNFTVDTKDTRFAKVFEGDSKFGIDRTAREFKATTGMKKILAEQRKRRHDQEDDGSSNHNKPPRERDEVDAYAAKRARQDEQSYGDGNNSNNLDVTQLANKLKNKFQQRK